MKRSIPFLAVLALGAAAPPDLVNYQGVLRNASGKPLDGSFDMVFRLLEAGSGNEILIDRHDGAIPVTVSGGLFNVRLGGGVVSDGAGPGTYTSLSQVFRDFQDVLLRVEVRGETLSPDVRVLAAGYALNATYLSGIHDSQFLRSDENDTAVGKIYFAGNPSGPGVSQGSVFINPSVAGFDDTLLGIGVASSERFRVDAEGEVSISGMVTIAAAASYGVYAGGPVGGGYFYSSLGDGEAYVGRGNTGVDGYGSSTGGAFEDSDSSGYGYVGFGDRGFHGGGNEAGGVFFDTDSSGYAYVGWGPTGVAGYGGTQGGYFSDLDGSSYARVGYSTYKIFGTGSVSFVQNHPERPDRVIVYHAPEASEVGVYTRGSARLSEGLARIPLDPTFVWVANPDVGLTAQVTPRGEWADLYVESVSTTELVVRSAGAASEAAFDYEVWGLRIGFEEASVVQEKAQEALIPSMADHRDLYARHPELRRFNALERFRGMDSAVSMTEVESLELARSSALTSAIGVYEPGSPEPSEPGDAGPARLPSTEVHPVREPVEAGDVVVVDPEGGRALRLGREPADTAVVGIVSGEAGAPLGNHAPVALNGTVLCKVDAGYGEIRVGDLLTTSATPGHAMRAIDAPPGSVLGKALEPLEAGQARIRILVMMR